MNYIGKNNSKQIGFTLVELLVVISIIGIFLGISVPAVQSVRSAARRTQCQNNQHQLGLAFTMHVSSMGGFPASRTLEPAVRGWTTDLLPYLDASNFLDQWDTNKSYFDNQNKRLLLKRMPIFQCPATPNSRHVITVDKDSQDKTIESISGIPGDYYVHHGGIKMPSTDPNNPGLKTYNNPLQECSGRCVAYQIEDGLSNTIVVNEQCGRPDLWVGRKKQSGTLVDQSWRSLWGAGPCSKLTGFEKNSIQPGYDRVINVCNNGIYSFHPSGANSLFMDGAVRFISDQTVPWIILALNTRDGKENVTPEDISLTCFDDSFVDPNTGKYPDGSNP